MSVTLISICVFVCVSAIVASLAVLLRGQSQTATEDRLQLLTGVGPVKSTVTNEPNLLAQPLDEKIHILEEFVSKFLNLRRFMEQADISMSPAKLLTICSGLAGFGVLISLHPLIHVGFAPVLAISLFFLPLMWVLFKRKRRLASFAKQLPEAMELISRALRAGHSLAAGISLVGEEMSDPIGREFSRCYEAQNLGQPLDEALEEMTDRVPNLDLRFFVTAVILQRQTGGDLAEILDKIGSLVRERFKIYGQIQALTGEGRLSGIVLLALPPVLFVVMFRMNPQYVMKLFEDPLGNKMLAAAIVMQILGALVIRKIINIRV